MRQALCPTWDVMVNFRARERQVTNQVVTARCGCGVGAPQRWSHACRASGGRVVMWKLVSGRKVDVVQTNQKVSEVGSPGSARGIAKRD